MKNSRANSLISCAVSLAVNAVLIVAIYLYPAMTADVETVDLSTPPADSPSTPEPQPPRPEPAKPLPAVPEPSESEAVEEPAVIEFKHPDVSPPERILENKEAVEKVIEKAIAMPDAERDRRLDKLLPKLEGYDAENARAIAEKVKNTFRVPDRAFAPVAGVAGEVDFNSLVPYEYDIVEDDGKRYFKQVLVDKDGRPFEMKKPESEMTAADRRAYTLFRRAGKNSSLRTAIDTALGIVDQRLQKSKSEAEAAKAPPTP